MPLTYRRNKVVLYANGRKFFHALRTSIRSAEHSILLEYYLINDDRTGRALVEELSKAVNRGVRVLMIYDYIGCIETPSSFFNALANQGIELTAFNTPSFKRGIHWFDRRDHRKMTIIDGDSAFLGGFNIGDEYSGIADSSKRFRDVGFSISGTAVKELIRIFAETWQMEHSTFPAFQLAAPEQDTPSPHGRANVVIISGGPHHRSSYIRNAFLLNIATASEEITIATPYFVPGPRIIRALMRAARRGVHVRLLLPARSDVPAILLVSRSSYGALLKAGIEIYEMEREILHAKVMLIDNERTVIGSANLDQRSFHRNFEINGVIDSSSFGREIHNVLEQELSAAVKITLEGHEGRGVFTRCLEKLVNLFGWFL